MKKIMVIVFMCLIMTTSVFAYGGIGGGMLLFPINKDYSYHLYHKIIHGHDYYKHPLINKLNFGKDTNVETIIFKNNGNKEFKNKKIIYSGMTKSVVMFGSVDVNINFDKYKDVEVYTSRNFKNWNQVKTLSLIDSEFETKKFFLVIGNLK